MNFTPDVSVLMTALNAEQFLAEAIESILQQQTKRTWELVFVDDGSTDNTLAIAQEFRARLANRMGVYHHADNGNFGISASRNLAMKHARGRHLAFLDSDDVWLPHHLETQIGVLESLPDVAMVYASAERWVSFDELFDEMSSRQADWGRNYLPPLVPESESAGLLKRGKLLRWFREDESFVPCICTVVLRSDVARSVGGFCDDFRGLYDDQAFHAKIALNHDVYAHDVCVARYRQHAASCCGLARQMPHDARREKLRLESFVRELANA